MFLFATLSRSTLAITGDQSFYDWHRHKLFFTDIGRGFFGQNIFIWCQPKLFLPISAKIFLYDVG